MTPPRIDYHYTIRCSKCWKSIKVTPTLEKNVFSRGDESIDCPKCGTEVKLPRPVSFTCSNCGHIIVCNRSEYEYLSSGQAGQDKLEGFCPECGKRLSAW